MATSGGAPSVIGVSGDTTRGIILMLAGMSVFTINDGLGKWLSANNTIIVMLLVRSLAATVALWPVIQRRGWGRVFAVASWRRHVVRAAFTAGEVLCFYWAARYLPLADVMTIYMAAPLIVTALSVPVLGERVGWRRWVAVLIGFAGVVLVLDPTGGFDPWPSIVAVIGVIIFSLGLMYTRLLRDDGEVTLIAYQTFGALVLGVALAVPAWVTPTPVDAMLMCLMGLMAMGGHVLMNRSLAAAPAAIVVPFQYVAIVWAVGIDLLVWGTTPTWAVLMGATLIIGSGLFVFHREQQLAKATVTETVIHDGPAG